LNEQDGQRKSQPIERPRLRPKYFLSLLILVLLISILLFPHVFPKNDHQGKVVVMDFSTLSQDWDARTHKFNSISPGDILRIEDVIVDLWVAEGQTHLKFNGAIVIIDADVSDDFEINDEVVIILTMSVYQDVQYGYKFQWFEEDNDGARGHLVIPPNCLYHLEDIESGLDIEPEDQPM
jgi:hypothetical protein